MAVPVISPRSNLIVPARVLIADNYYVFAIGAARTLKKSPVTKGVQTVIVGDIRHAEFRLSQERFDVVLISDSLLPVPELNLKALMKAQPIMIGVVYDTLDPVQVAECYRSGVSAILSRRISADDLCDSLANILAGKEMIDSDALEAVLSSVKNENSEKHVDNNALTRKEQKIAYMIAKFGKSNKDIAADLSMSEQVVKNHLRSIFVKMKVDSRIQLALKLHDPFGDGSNSATV